MMIPTIALNRPALNRALAAAMSLLSCGPLMAADDLLVGSFGHEFTRERDAPVWIVEREHAGYRLRTTGDGATYAAREWSAAERVAFWRRMSWPEASSPAARCVAAAEDIICHLPAQARKQIDWLASKQSDYFHYSVLGGVMEIRRVASDARHAATPSIR